MGLSGAIAPCTMSVDVICVLFSLGVSWTGVWWRIDEAKGSDVGLEVLTFEISPW